MAGEGDPPIGGTGIDEVGLDAKIEGSVDTKTEEINKDVAHFVTKGKELIQSIDKNANKSTRQYIKEVAKGGIKPLIETIIIGSIAFTAAVLLGPFGWIGLAGAALVSLFAGAIIVTAASMYEEKQKRIEEERKAQEKLEKGKGLGQSKHIALEENRDRGTHLVEHGVVEHDDQKRSQKTMEHSLEKKQASGHKDQSLSDSSSLGDLSTKSSLSDKQEEQKAKVSVKAKGEEHGFIKRSLRTFGGLWECLALH